MELYESSQELFQSKVKKLLENPEYKSKPRNLSVHEELGFSARIKNPRDRIVFSPDREFNIEYALGECIWYFSASDSLDMIQYYAPSYNRFSDDGKTLYGAYGPRLFDSGIKNIIQKLKKDPDSRQAVSLIWRSKDMSAKTKDLPCTISLQFFIRENKLNLITNMRSNDLWLGLPYDIFCFTIIQEYVSSKLNIDMGFYQHQAGSLHLYEKDFNKIKDNVESDSEPMEKFYYYEIDQLVEDEEIIRNSKEIIINKKDSEQKSISRDLTLVLFHLKTKKLKKDSDKIKELIKSNAIRRVL